ncbi:MAG: DUF4870 domain-containing protein [Chloroflexi bacterium]|nr:DUF4870 domain-containing protein [Chloroflexota bacterium]
MSDSSSGLQQNIAGFLCYLFGWISGLIFFLIEKKNSFIRFHAMQSIIFSVIWIICSVFLWIPVVGWIIYALFVVVWIILMVKAFMNEKFKLPIIGNLAEKWSA